MAKYITKLISGETMYYLKDSEARESLGNKVDTTDSRLSDARPASNTVDTYSSTGTNPVSGKAVAAAIETLDVSSVGGTNKYIKTISLTNGKISATAGTVDTSVTADSSNLITSGAVKAAIDALPEPMVFKGSLGTGGTVTSLPTAAAANKGFTYKVITAGTYASQAAKVGDTFISDGSSWVLIPSGDEPGGTVTSVTIKATSPISIDSSAAITSSGTRTISHAASGVTAGTYKSVTVDAKGHVTAGTNPTKLSGYGITDAAVNNLLTNENLNNVTTPGFYNASGGNTVTNKPSNFDSFGLEVIHSAAGNYYVQIIYASAEAVPYRRYCNNGTWSSWVKDKLTDTTYSAGTGLSLSGTQFSLALTKALVTNALGYTPPTTNTTYSDFVKSGESAAHGLVPKPPTTAGTTKYLREDGTWNTPPDTNTWRGILNNLTSESTTDSLSAKQGYLLANGSARDNTKLPISGGTLSNSNFGEQLMIERTGSAIMAAIGFKNSHGVLGYLAAGTVDGAFVRYNAAVSDNYTILDSSNSSVSKSGETLTVKINGTSQSLTNTNTWKAMTGATASANGTTGYVNATPPKDGYNTKFLRADGTWAVPTDTNTDTKVTTTVTEPTAGSTWYPIFTTSNSTVTSTTVSNPTGFAIKVLNGTATTAGYSYLLLGNSTAAGTAGNKTGCIRLYNDKGAYFELHGTNGTTSNRALYLPNAGGTLVAHTTNTAIGGSSKPVYISAEGVATAIGYTIEANVPSNAKFTDTTYSSMTGANASTAGKAGLVPAPAAGKQTSFLRGDGTWAVPTDTNTDTKVTQTSTTANANYEVLLSGTADNTTRTEEARKTSTLKYNPSTTNLLIQTDTGAPRITLSTETGSGTIIDWKTGASDFFQQRTVVTNGTSIHEFWSSDDKIKLQLSNGYGVTVNPGDDRYKDTSYEFRVCGKSIGESWNNTSDVRLKNITSNVDFDVEDIANAPLFKFTWIDPNMGDGVNVGTSAQYWETVVPELITKSSDDMNTLSMQYGVTGLASAIVLARKVVEQEETIKSQEQRIKALEDAIAEIKNKLGN